MAEALVQTGAVTARWAEAEAEAELDGMVEGRV